MAKIDLKKTLRHLYRPGAREVALVDVPAMHYLMVDGKGDPNRSQAYAQALEALYSVAYTLKFFHKQGPAARDFVVMPLEGLWWADDMSVFQIGDKSEWQWTMMILQPDFVTAEDVSTAIFETSQKKDLAALQRLRFGGLHEGTCAQIMHIGPFEEEGPTIERLHDFIQSRGVRRGKHHEIYLSDIRRANPANWKTVIRQPMTPKN